ncbi:MAG: sulfatase-like hydrolase/transferase [Acidobacteria bacterium]|nr:sulfatase-like hydrolase/transferase [Acidobacteriota bacterium]
MTFSTVVQHHRRGRIWLHTLLGVTLLTIACSNRGSAPKRMGTQADQPNIILILTDDLDAKPIEFMPRLRALLADQGVTFTNMFVTYSTCCPSRASILTGQYPHNNDILGNVPPLGDSRSFTMRTRRPRLSRHG